MYRRTGAEPEVLLVHPGGPYWAKKDDGAWSIRKGEYAADEDALVAARRECAEETGCVPDGTFEPLGSFRQPSGKIVDAWAVEAFGDAKRQLAFVFAVDDRFGHFLVGRIDLLVAFLLGGIGREARPAGPHLLGVRERR